MKVLTDMSIVASFIIVLTAGSSAAQERSLPPHVRYQAPESTWITAKYDCAGKDVDLVLTSHEGRVFVEAYSNGTTRASESQRAAWNGWLAEIGTYDHHTFSCQMGDHQRVTVAGIGPDGLAYRRVTVWWAGELMGRVGQARQ